MAADEKWHSMVTQTIGGSESYGKGCWPNPWAEKQAEWERQENNRLLIQQQLSLKIKMIFEPRFITGVETCELMEKLITMIGAAQILELGMCTGFGSMHMLRSIVGKEGTKLTSIDARPAHDKEFFASPKIAKHFEFIQGWTPDALKQLHGRQFDFCFVDSDHSVEHTKKELEALKLITHPGTMIALHDVPAWKTPSQRFPVPVRVYLEELIAGGEYNGLMLPSPNQLDCEEEYGKGYDSRCNPGLAILIRK